MSDASCLSKPCARSVTGFFAYLGTPVLVNGPIACGSKMIDCVVSALSEAETAGGFKAAQQAVPQPTLIQMDNTVALGFCRNDQRQAFKSDGYVVFLVDRSCKAKAFC